MVLVLLWVDYKRGNMVLVLVFEGIVDTVVLVLIGMDGSMVSVFQCVCLLVGLGVVVFVQHTLVFVLHTGVFV